MVATNTIERAKGTGFPRRRLVGRDAGPVGRLFRVAFGTVGLIPVIVGLTDSSAGEVAAGLGWLVAIAVAFIAVLALARPWLEGRTASGLAGWPGSALLMLPLIVYPLGVLPEAPTVGLRLYVDGSVLLAGLIGYGGLEMAALSTLVLGYRPVLYTQYNVVDVVERSPAVARIRSVAVAAVVLAVIGFAWFWIVPSIVVEGGPFDAAKPTVTSLDPVAAALIVVAGPLLLLAGRGAAAGRRVRWALAGLLVVFGAGALVGAMPDALYAVIILVGLVTGAVRLVTRSRRGGGRGHGGSAAS